MGAHPFGVIIIDDDEVDVEAISRSLLGLDSPPYLLVFQTANKALQALQDQRPLFQPTTSFLILLDLSLPGMTGLEFLEHIRKDESLRRIPIFVLTELHSEPERATAHEFGVVGYFRKLSTPSDAKALAARIEIYMRSGNT
jgi:CheY-like chemotaxis protein